MQELSGAIGRGCMHVEVPPRDQLEEQLESLLDRIASPPAKLDGLGLGLGLGLVHAGLAHLWFLTLHPHENGSGRLARAITNRLHAQDCKAQSQQAFSGRALGISSQILREREGYTTAPAAGSRGLWRSAIRVEYHMMLISWIIAG